MSGSDTGALDWLVSFKSPLKIWEEHPTYLLYEWGYYICGLLTLVHAWKSGGKYGYFWLATIFHGFTVEFISYNVPTIDCFWHAQSSVTLLNKRLPAQVVFLYPFFLYTSFVTVSRLKLPKWVEPWAVGLCVVMIDMPYDILGVKLVWWSWHDTDPNIFDRHYWVPWTSYFSHLVFAASVVILFNSFRWFVVGKGRHDAKSGKLAKEFLACLLTGLFGMMGGVLQLMPVYHPIHDIYNVHSEVIVLSVFAVIVVITWATGRRRECDTTSQKGVNYLAVALGIHYIFLSFLPIFAKPENVVSVGFHQETGPCDALQEVHSAIGQLRYKGKYLCVDDYDEPYFDFHCTESRKGPAGISSWYSICGTPFENRAEYVLVITTICSVFLFIFIQILYQPNPKFLRSLPKKKVNKSN